jgi:hypothetical protein
MLHSPTYAIDAVESLPKQLKLEPQRKLYFARSSRSYGAYGRRGVHCLRDAAEAGNAEGSLWQPVLWMIEDVEEL